MPKKALIILLDGLGDRSYREFQWQTPLQAASTPTLDRMAFLGASGSYHAAVIGQALPSENAHFALFGYSLKQFPGRGALEALGAGIDLAPGDVAVLTHFASLYAEKNTLFLKQGKPKTMDAEAELLFGALPKPGLADFSIEFIQTHNLFGILKIQGEASPFFTDTDPFIDGRMLSEVMPWQTHAEDVKTCRTAATLKDFLITSYRQLNSLPYNKERLRAGLEPINGLVTQRAGQLKTIRPFSQKYGLKGLLIASGLVYAGLAHYIGLAFEKVNDSSEPGEDLAERLKIARDEFEHYDFIHVHTKAPDEAAHAKDPQAKREIIELLDQGLTKQIRPFLDDPEMLVVVTADHSTPSSGPLIHSGETVPVLMVGEGVRRDGVQQFDELCAVQGALGRLNGPEIMYLILNFLNRSKLRGIMDTPEDQPFWPGKYKGFQI